ncbi:MAG: nucleoside triphosphate pyrophosphohydrolase [Anaerolineae bacterium]
MSITIVGLGPGGGRLLTREAWQLLSAAETVYLRTSRHPAVADLPSSVRCVSFDHLYDSADSFEAVYTQIVAELLRLGRQGEVIYAVPGHPFVGESTVTALVAAADDEDMPVTIVAGLSFVEPVLTAVRQDALDGLQTFDAIEMAGYKYPPVSSDVPLLLGQVYNRLLASELKLVLMSIYPDEHPVSLIHAAGTRNESVEPLPLYAIDRSDQLDHLTSLFVPPLPYKSNLSALADTVAVLRSPEGCPWDQEQTPQSMRSDFLEEASEVLAALDAEDDEALCEELGDLLYHLVMQAQMAAEAGAFTLSDVVAGIEAKLKYRHPHVWGDGEVSGSAEVVHNWHLLKEREKPARSRSLVDNVPQTLPALAYSQKLQGQVRKVGFDWPDVSGVFAKLSEEISELREADTDDERRAELGDVLFVLANLAHWLGVDAESALREANSRFTRRFRLVEEMVAARELDWAELDLEGMEALWQEAKRELAARELNA